MNAILKRTAEGDRAAKDSSFGLPRKHRILLMAIDGKTPRHLYLNSLTRFGDLRAMMDELEAMNLIVSHYADGSSRDDDSHAAEGGIQTTERPKIRHDADQAGTVQLQNVGLRVQRLEQALNLMSDFVTEHYPELAFQILIEMEKLDTLDALLAVLPDYQLAISQKPQAAAQHIFQINQLLSRPY
jgi:hypothetical protein